jgi:hypothetical protein
MLQLASPRRKGRLSHCIGDWVGSRPGMGAEKGKVSTAVQLIVSIPNELSRIPSVLHNGASSNYDTVTGFLRLFPFKEVNYETLTGCKLS